jgi:hypothetical protein
MRPLPPCRLRRPSSCVPILISVLLALLVPTPARTAEDAPASDGKTGREIYDEVIDNRFERFRQNARLVSGNRADNAQESRMTVLWKSFRDAADEPVDGVFSKTIVRYTHPFDLRHSGYLVINNADRGDDQFVYLNSRRRVRRVNLRGEAVMGSDFSFEDVIPREIEDATYDRLPDEVLDGVPSYVIEITPGPNSNSEYSKLRSWIDKQRPIVLRTLYWDQNGVQNKELVAPAAEFREHAGVWIPMRTEMKNLVSESWSRLLIEDFEANPPVPDGEFDPRRLESH